MSQSIPRSVDVRTSQDPSHASKNPYIAGFLEACCSLTAGFADRVGDVYCFLSRREGGSEELVTTAANPPKINTNSGSAFECS